ncbi:MAG: hypothetical protein LAP87_16875 [Acidobacteriia bacterium]|nr:hypothetical protein [Terriglobia bacterium]
MGKGTPLTRQGPAAGKVLGAEDLSQMFGLDMAEGGEAGKPVKAKRAGKAPEVQTASAKRGKRPAGTKLGRTGKG